MSDSPDRNARVLPPWVINLFFAVGIASSVAIRLLIVLNHVAREWVRPCWYLGVSGYLVFFAYRYLITRRRRRLIADCRLVEKLAAGEALSAEEQAALEYVVQSVAKSRENINYLAIFALSFAAIAADVLLSLMGK